MDTLVDDTGNFPLPSGIKSEEYSRAYEAAREAIIKGENLFKTNLLRKTLAP